MRKPLSFLLSTLTLACLVLTSARADTTYVSGHITENTTWTQAGSPYVITDTVTVDSLVTLTIEPGVGVRINTSQSRETHFLKNSAVLRGTRRCKISLSLESFKKYLTGVSLVLKEFFNIFFINILYQEVDDGEV